MKINLDMNLKEIVDKFPKSLNVLINNGFPQLEDEKYLNTVGNILKLNSALKSKGYDTETYLRLLEESINEEQVDITLKEQPTDGNIQVMGLLPCPVRIPMLESFDNYVNEINAKYNIKTAYKLEAASQGASWMEDNILNNQSIDDLPEIFISAGFETFFDKKLIGKYKEEKLFIDPFDDEINNDFSGIQLKDPSKDYSIISVVPAVFMVNLNELGDRKVPKTWNDILKPEFEGRVSLPVGDFDLFNSLLLSFYKEYGEEGIKKLGKAMHSSMHPSQMVKNGNSSSSDKPIVTILPYFFTKMAKAKSLQIVWPEDGAIISPIFMLIKKPLTKPVEEIAKFFTSIETGEILAHKGLFPSLNKGVNNNLPENSKFKWVGWEFINNNDIGQLIVKANDIFNKYMMETVK